MTDYASQDSRQYSTCDQEVWVRDRIRKAVDMAISIKKLHKVSAEDGMVEGAIRGIVNACSIEVISTLGLKVAHINLRDPWRVP